MLQLARISLPDLAHCLRVIIFQLTAGCRVVDTSAGPLLSAPRRQIWIGADGLVLGWIGQQTRLFPELVGLPYIEKPQNASSEHWGMNSMSFL
jgi:hypothetical protein